MITDVATKMIWEFSLKTRSNNEVLEWVKHWVSVILPMYPGNNHDHADGGAELIGQKLKSYLLQAFGTRVTWSSTDTPELNSISERKFRTLGEMTLALLADSSLPKLFWRDAYMCFCDITRIMMPTPTCPDWVSPAEYVPGDRVPNLSCLRRWECKAHVVIPRLIGA